MFTVGLVAGGVLTATALWLLSGFARPLPEDARYGLILVAAAVAVLRDVGVVRLRLPQNSWQIPQHVLQHGRLTGPLGFGFQLGTGVRTYVSSTAPYVLAVGLLAGGLGVTTAVLAGAGFGLGRAATPALRRWSPDPASWDELLRARSRPLVVGSGVAVAVVLVISIGLRVA